MQTYRGDKSTVQVRDISPETLAALKRRAAASGYDAVHVAPPRAGRRRPTCSTPSPDAPSWQGLLVAPGDLWPSEHGEGFGLCVWSSRDGGWSWGASMVPGNGGRSLTVHLLRDGQDLVAVTVRWGEVVAQRIVDPRGQLRI